MQILKKQFSEKKCETFFQFCQLYLESPETTNFWKSVFEN